MFGICYKKYYNNKRRRLWGYREEELNMKKMVYCLIAISLFLLGRQPIKAHPGRTDASGCHVCRTNCDKWGLSTGEYHCHNGGSSSTTSNSNSSSSSNKAPVSSAGGSTSTNNITQKTNTATSTVNYAAKGKTDGYNAKKNNPNMELENAVYTYTNSTYKKAFEEAFKKAETELKDISQTQGKENGEKDALKTEEYQLDKIPDGVIKTVYEETYKQAYDSVEKSEIDVNDAMAKQNSFRKVYHEQAEKSVDFHGLKKYETAYKAAYEEYYKKYTKEKENYIQQSKEKGKQDGEKRKEKDYSFLEDIKDTAVYKQAVEAYDQSYDENYKEMGMMGTLLSLLIMAGFIYGVYRLVKILIRKVRKNNL